MSNAFLGANPLGALFALKPLRYAIRTGLANVAFGASINADKFVARAIGFVWLLITGASVLLVGFQNGTVIDMPPVFHWGYSELTV